MVDLVVVRMHVDGIETTRLKTTPLKTEHTILTMKMEHLQLEIKPLKILTMKPLKILTVAATALLELILEEKQTVHAGHWH